MVPIPHFIRTLFNTNRPVWLHMANGSTISVSRSHASFSPLKGGTYAFTLTKGEPMPKVDTTQSSPQQTKCPNCDFEEALLFVYTGVINCPNCGHNEERR